MLHTRTQTSTNLEYQSTSARNNSGLCLLRTGKIRKHQQTEWSGEEGKENVEGNEIRGKKKERVIWKGGKKRMKVSWKKLLKRILNWGDGLGPTSWTTSPFEARVGHASNITWHTESRCLSAETTSPAAAAARSPNYKKKKKKSLLAILFGERKKHGLSPGKNTGWRKLITNGTVIC